MGQPTSFAGLYRERVLDHGRAPRHAGALASASHRASAHNALCGDRVEVQLRLAADGCIAELRHQSVGCLLCLASASLMACDVGGQDADGVELRLQALKAALASGDGEGLDDLGALAGVSAHPARHRCVLLPWECLLEALAGAGGEA